MRNAASQKSLTKHFRKKTKSLSSTSELQRLSESVGQSEHARKLQHLEFCITEDEPMDSATMDNIEKVVTAVLSLLRQHLVEGCLQRLSICLQDNGELRDWEVAWQIVACGWTVLVRSLTSSDLVINELDVFTTSFGSISLDKFYPSASLAALAGSFNRLRSLYLSLSHSPDDVIDARLDDTSDGSSGDAFEDGLENLLDDSKPSVEKSQSYCNALCDFLNLCPALQHLGLHWYILTYEDTAPLLEQQKLLEYIVRRCAISNLQSVSLRGIYTSQAVLLRLAERSQLRSVVMDNTYLVGNDTFRPFFDYITPNLDTVRLSDLWEAMSIDFEFADPPEIRQKLIREGLSARQPIAYHQCRIQPNDEIEVVMRMRKQRLEYGPPQIQRV